MKKLFFFGLIVVPVVATALLWVLITDGISCLRESSSVTVTVRKITLSEVTPDLSKVDVQIRLENNNSEEAIVEKLEYDIYLGYQNKWYWLGRAEEEMIEVGADNSADFTMTTNIDNSQLVDVVTGSFLGEDASEMRVDGRSSFKVGTDSIEVEFDKKDTEPYKMFVEDESTSPESVESGTEGAISE